jgi:hypothetical protein
VEIPTSPSNVKSASQLLKLKGSLQEQNLIRYVMKDGFQTISAATVDKLIEFSVDEFYRDSEYLDTFLISHPYFIDSINLLNRFITM